MYDPDIHHRHSTRIYGHDYSLPGYDFVTICTHNCTCILGRVKDDMVLLSSWGRVAYDNLRKVPKHYRFVDIDRFVVMPNHIHCILLIQDPGNSVEESSVGA